MTGAFWLTSVLQTFTGEFGGSQLSVLFGVSATDPATFAAVSLLIIGAVLLACYNPTRAATNVDPMVALRHD
jgi:putative ABC transport system permease protein